MTLLLILSGAAHAGELSRGSTVAEVGNTNHNSKDFAIRIETGAGICSGWIVFPEAKAASASTHNQAFLIALTAATEGKKVRIHNFENNSCDGANFISLSSR